MVKYFSSLNLDIHFELDYIHNMKYFIKNYSNPDNLDEKDKIIINQSKSMIEMLGIINNQIIAFKEQEKVIRDLEDKIKDLDVDNIVKIEL